MVCTMGEYVMLHLRHLCNCAAVDRGFDKNGNGCWLRQQKVNGLVYPSARCDCRVDSQGDRVLRSSGWHFVDYRGAHKVEAPRPFGWLAWDLVEAQAVQGICAHVVVSNGNVCNWKLCGVTDRLNRRERSKILQLAKASGIPFKAGLPTKW